MAFVKIALQSNRMLPINCFFFVLRPASNVYIGANSTHFPRRNEYTGSEQKKVHASTNQSTFQTQIFTIPIFVRHAFGTFNANHLRGVRPTLVAAAAAKSAATTISISECTNFGRHGALIIDAKFTRHDILQ